jgi:hypothetical protein
MDLRRLLILLVLLLVVFAFKPLGVWAYLQRLWARRDLIVGTLFIIIVLYLAYGLYTMYRQHMLDWLFAY